MYHRLGEISWRRHRRIAVTSGLVAGLCAALLVLRLIGGLWAIPVGMFLGVAVFFVVFARCDSLCGAIYRGQSKESGVLDREPRLRIAPSGNSTARR
jgi:hypothetical protein